MTDSTPDREALDRWLRRGLEPGRETSQRVASQSLDAAPARSGLIRGRWAAVGGATLVGAVLVSIWARGGNTPVADRMPIRITNHGELVTAIDPAGDAWLHAPVRVVDDDAPRLIITMGEADAD